MSGKLGLHTPIGRIVVAQDDTSNWTWFQPVDDGCGILYLWTVTFQTENGAYEDSATVVATTARVALNVTEAVLPLVMEPGMEVTALVRHGEKDA